ncbi:heavy metal translocating P-type ATPase [Staphylococcus marylandisciuri]
MSCAACAHRIEKELNSLTEVKASVNLSTEQATVIYPKKAYGAQDFITTIKKTGYNVKLNKVELHIIGMTCAACSNRIEKVLSKLPGVINAAINLTTEQGTITYLPDNLDVSDLIHSIQKLGYDAEEIREDTSQHDHKRRELNHKLLKLIISSILSLPLVLTMFTHLLNINLPSLLMNPYFQFTLASLVQFGIGWQFYVDAYKSLRSGSANMAVLVSLGTSAAYLYSVYQMILWARETHFEPHLYFETSAVLTTLILFGKYLEARAKSRTTQALSKLLNLQAKKARVITESEEKLVDINKVRVGQYIKIKPGETIPIDGRVIEGETTVNESMLTGESMPIHKVNGAEVIGGTLNQYGTVVIEATHVGNDTALASIVKTVEAAQGSKAPIQRLADTISGYFVPIVVIVAILTFLIWITLVQVGHFEPALVASVSVLVIACPCALGLATPTSIMVGTGKAAETGILFKGGEFVEQAHNIDTLVLDKTGTITHGEPQVTHMEGDKQTLKLIASLENHSEHPLGKAIVKYAKQFELHLEHADHFQTIPGQGIIGSIHEQDIIVGNAAFLEENEVHIPQEVVKETSSVGTQAQTVIFSAINREYTDYITVSDQVKSSARTAISQLKSLGISVVMLTGDNYNIARSIAQQVGIDEVIAEVKPEDKAHEIIQLQHTGAKVGMVGDGINDAPALVQADIGIAVGTGSDIAIESADITILGSDLMLLPKAIQSSRYTIRNIRQNLFWALGYNVAGIPIAACGILAPWVAGLAMALSSVSVVTNALRLRHMKL